MQVNVHSLLKGYQWEFSKISAYEHVASVQSCVPRVGGAAGITKIGIVHTSELP